MAKDHQQRVFTAADLRALTPHDGKMAISASALSLHGFDGALQQAGAEVGKVVAVTITGNDSNESFIVYVSRGGNGVITNNDITVPGNILGSQRAQQAALKLANGG